MNRMEKEEIKKTRIQTNGIWMNIAEKGSGPKLVVLLHGFPELWYSWRHQIGFLANNGYHVVAPDLRGFGDSDSPLSPFSYSVFHLVADISGILDHFAQQQAFVVGHDWGATIGWHLSLFRPDRIRAFIAVSVPYFPMSKLLISSLLLLVMAFMSVSSRAEKAFARYDYLTVMKKFLLITSTAILVAPTGMESIDYLQTPALIPHWITEEELQVYADEFQETGFTGPPNYYRAMDFWELCGAWQGSEITVPTKFIVGDKDIGFETFGVKDYVKGESFRDIVPNLEQVVVLDGHHFIQHEQPLRVSQELLAFLRKF